MLDIAFRSSRLSTTGRRSVVCGRANIDEEFAQRAAALERCFSKLSRAPTPELETVPREASSLSRHLQAGLADFPQRVCRTLGVATPHKVGKQETRETGSESRWTLLWCKAPPPPTLPCLSTFGVFLSRHLVVSSLAMSHTWRHPEDLFPSIPSAQFASCTGSGNL